MNKLLKASLAALFFAATALQAQIEINDNISVTGFLDMSATDTDASFSTNRGSPATEDAAGSDGSSYNLDQAEIDFLLSFDEISGQIDLNYLGGNDGEFDLEQAFLAYDLGGGSNVEAGKFLGYMGWETAEPTGLYQYSYAYDIAGGTIPRYHNGVRYNYNDDFLSLGLALLDSAWSPDASIGDSSYGLEAKIAIRPVEGWTVFLGLAKDAMDAGQQDRDLINFWTSYEIGNVTYALEWNDYDFGPMNLGSQFLVMANVGITDNLGLTFRVSEDAQDFKGGDTSTKYTISPGWSVNDNLGMLFEISQSDFGSEGDVTSLAFETIFTF
jgi:hypothetical protein